MLRVVVWGLGRHAVKNILPAISATSGLELYGVCSRAESVVDTCVREWNCKGWIDAAPMLLDPTVDIVFVATPIGLHFEHGMRVLKSNKHFWCEKPLTGCLKDTRELLNLSRAKGLSVCEGHMYLHHPQFSKLIGFISSGYLGSMVSVSCRFGIPKLEHNTFRTNHELGGGALLDVGCYPISAIKALFPEDRMEVRYAAITKSSGSMVDTDGHAIIEISNGAKAHLEWRTNCAYRNEVDLWGEAGSVFSDKVFSKPPSHVPVFKLRNAQGAETIEYGEAGDHFSLMLRGFLRTVSDSAAAEAQRVRILGGAELLDQIVLKSDFTM